MIKLNSSFRDPSGFLFTQDSKLYRSISSTYSDNYIKLMSSGLYNSLVSTECLIPHEEVPQSSSSASDVFKIIHPEYIDLISYPYEWCFSQLKDAALLTLKIQKEAISYGMSLKDASCYNVQFNHGKPVFIDTLSFEEFNSEMPWVAYRQFCQHFLAPLALMSMTDVRMNKLLVTNIDGIPLALASKLLPFFSKLKWGLLVHIFLHSKWQNRYEGNCDSSYKSSTKFSLTKHEALIDSLMSTILSIKQPSDKTEWEDYYSNTNYSDTSFEHKKKMVSEFIDIAAPAIVWDLGANTGEFSRIASQKGISTVAFDIDSNAVEQNYTLARKYKDNYILPLIQDLTTPSPSIGFNLEERDGLKKRANADLIMALALIHHLAISNNLPFENIAEFFASLAPYLIVEFVPKEDSKVHILLLTREDIFPNYNKEEFEKAFSRHYKIEKVVDVANTERTLYLMSKI